MERRKGWEKLLRVRERTCKGSGGERENEREKSMIGKLGFSFVFFSFCYLILTNPFEEGDRKSVV